MEILYFGSVCDDEWFTKTSNNRAIPSQVAQYMFEKALIQGISDLQYINMKIYHLHQEPYYSKGGESLIFGRRKQKINEKYIVNYLSNINLPLIKEVYTFFQGLILTTKWAIENYSNKNKVILTPFNYTPLSFGIYLSSKIFRIKRVNIFTDLSSEILNSKKDNMPWFKKILLPYYLKLVNFIEHNYDGYILFAEPMNNKVNPSNKPFIVMEGIFNNNLDLTEVSKSKAIMYAGTLAFKYGVKNILNAFEQIKDDELELWLFGDGDMREYIEKLVLRDRRVKYFGFKPRIEVFEYEKKSILLINSRDPNDEYTKYSFPSKTFEYMVSGTPFLTTNLKCIPEEYTNYLYIVNESDCLKNKIMEAINKQPSDLKKFGKSARQFILKNKNSNVQSLKIIEMINNKIIEIES